MIQKKTAHEYTLCLEMSLHTIPINIMLTASTPIS